jgi:hypothetical protein
MIAADERVVARRRAGGDGSPVAALRPEPCGRRTKLVAGGFIALWKSAGAVLEIWSWAMQGLSGSQKVWQVRREGL